MIEVLSLASDTASESLVSVAIGRTVTVLNLKTLVGLNRLVFCGLVKVIEIIERDNPLSG